MWGYYNMQGGCYALESVVTERPGTMDGTIDCTYVLTMEGSSRAQTIKDQVAFASLTSKTVYQHNKGYKKCLKNLRVPGPNYDLEHALKNACKHALAQGYTRVLVLEDDCEFDERIRDPEILGELRAFLETNDPSVYTLGSFLHLPSPLDVLGGASHQLLLFHSASHAVIYNEAYMRWIVANDCLMGHVDLETNRHASKYTYKIPLAYQKITETENSTEGWGYVYPLMRALIFEPLELATKVQPGYDIIKLWADRISVIIFILAVGYVGKRLYDRRR